LRTVLGEVDPVPGPKHDPRFPSQVQDAVREKYGEIARSVGKTGGCCGPSSCGCGDPITSNLYSDAETSGLPGEAVAVSLGCGNPTALIELEPGQTVLDLGSGGGIDVLLSAKRVGPAGKWDLAAGRETAEPNPVEGSATQTRSHYPDPDVISSGSSTEHLCRLSALRKTRQGFEPP